MKIIKYIKRYPSLSSKGFSLIELIVMIVVLGLLAAIATTRLSDISVNVRISSAINQISSDINLVKEIALAKHQPMSVVFDTISNVYIIKNNGNTMIDYPGSENGTIDLSVGLFSGVNISDVNLNGSTQVNFDKWGNVLNNGTITLNSDHVISINKITGFTEVNN
ncbi:MAG: GspH/FimT family pseudopilin [Candidatus Marinimicrobia bacterium]|nr:GspH/FimT family pseudopilin [Candidatus Neomarinimicrobiota bacterium]|tara:strand:+ start:31 stop:525 length:495 start_codon:yes stop_codon:yes gene_type:complete